MNVEINPSEYKVLIVDDVISNVLLKVLLTNEKFNCNSRQWNSGFGAGEAMGSIKMVLNMLMLNLPVEKIGAEMYELLTMANRTTEDVFSLLDNLLKWTKSQIGNLNVVYQDVDAVEVVDSVIDVFNMVAGLKKITIREEKPEKLPVCTDIDMLKTIIRNLLSNAIKFSNENSEVLVKMEEQGDTVVVSVKDSGCGIDEEGQQKLLHTDTHFSTFGTNNEEGSDIRKQRVLKALFSCNMIPPIL